jgi:hypothetical protein
MIADSPARLDATSHATSSYKSVLFIREYSRQSVVRFLVRAQYRNTLTADGRE